VRQGGQHRPLSVRWSEQHYHVMIRRLRRGEYEARGVACLLLPI